MKQIKELASRITGNGNGSLGLHPAVYFYGPSGQHQSPMFMGTALLIKKKLLNNDPTFFKKFTLCRARLEDTLVEHKKIVAAILQGFLSKGRVEKYAMFLDSLVERLAENINITEEEIVEISGLSGKIFVGSAPNADQLFSDNVKSETFIRKALDSSVKCSICKGFLDPTKSVSYDHIKRRRDGGGSGKDNCDLTHPYCNQSIKN